MKTKDVALAAAAVALVCGTFVFLVSRLNKSDEKKKKKKRVRFAPDMIVSPRTRRGERTREVRRNKRVSSETNVRNAGNEENRGMPADKVALFNEILRDIEARRLARSEESSL